MSRITYIPNRVIDANGISDGASIYVYQSGGSTPIELFSDEATTVPVPNPYVVDAGAPVPALYYNYTGNIRVRVVAADGSIPQDDDPYERLVTDVDLSSTNPNRGASLVALTQGGTVADAVKYLTPEMFGAVGDGETDDTVSVQATLDACPEGGEVQFPRMYKITGFVGFWTPNSTLRGPGGLVGGSLRIGKETIGTGETRDLNITVDNMRFSGGDDVGNAEGTINGIELQNARRVTIMNSCRFLNLDKAIAAIRYAQEGFHRVGIIKILNNDFKNVNYAFHVELNDPLTDWQNVNDCEFSGNNVNRANIKHIHCDGIDGIHGTGNVFFSLSYQSTDEALKALREECIYIGPSDWVHLTDNNIFEPGLEGIKLDAPKHFNIRGNLIAYPGQKAPASAIMLTGQNGQPFGTIEGNTLSRFTKHGIEFDTNKAAGAATASLVGPNVYEYDENTSSYEGTTPLDSIDHYNVYVEPTSRTSASEFGGRSTGGLKNNIRTSPASSLQLTDNAAVSGLQVVKTFAASTQQAVCKIAPPTAAGNAGRTLGGIVVVSARRSTTTTANGATYVLLVGASGTSSGGVVEIAKTGLTEGSGSQISYPSFTWAYDLATSELRATPLQVTEGEFYFEITTLGNLNGFTV